MIDPLSLRYVTVALSYMLTSFICVQPNVASEVYFHVKYRRY